MEDILKDVGKMSFEEFMKSIDNQQFESFKKLIEEEKEIPVNYYLCIFLGTFLGLDYFPQSKEEFNKMTRMFSDSRITVHFQRTINSISLCEQEIDFFHKMVEIKDSENYIEKCIEEYHKIKNLDRCQLGSNIMKCLKASANIKIII